MGNNQGTPPPPPPVNNQMMPPTPPPNFTPKKIKGKLVLLLLIQEVLEDVCIAGFIFGHLVQIKDFGYI